MPFLEFRRVLTEKRFRWASCQLDSLRKCLRPGTVRETLRTLPSTLDETYEQILLNIDEQYRQEAQLALTWLVASRRVLTVEELAEAISIETDSEDSFNPSNRFFEPNSICNVLSGVVSLVQGNGWLGIANVRLAHFSVEEYLVSDRLAKSRASQFHVPFRISNFKLATASLIYLQWAKDFVKEDTGHPISRFSYIVEERHFSAKTQELPKKVPLLAYACKFWYLHIRMCEGFLSEREIRLVKDFLECQERIELFKRGTYGAYDYEAEKGCHDPYIDPTRPSGEPVFVANALYHATRLGLVDIVTALLEETSRDLLSLRSLASSQPMHQMSTSGAFGNELRIACFYDQKETVEKLLNAGADVEAMGGDFKTAMGACMRSRIPNHAIIQILLENVKTVDPDVDWNIGWALRWASMEGHFPVVRTLMSKINRVGPQAYTWTLDYFDCFDGQHYYKFHRPGLPGGSLHWRKDFKGSESYNRCGTAPYEAASAGYHEILSLLISDWSNINEEDDEGRTSLYWAAFYGHTETVRLLLQNRARTHGHGGIYYWTPAYWARMRGFAEIEELLATQ